MDLDARYKHYDDVQLVAIIEHAEAMLEKPETTQPQKQAVEASLVIMRKEAADRLSALGQEMERVERALQEERYNNMLSDQTNQNNN